MAMIADFGRLPEADEFSGADQLVEPFGSLKRAFALVRRVTGPAEWNTIRQRRTEDLLVYLALARFRKRPPLGQLPRTLQRDMRAFFGTYIKACRQADELLFRAGDAATIDEACKRSPIGKLLPDDLYVHRSAFDSLEPIPPSTRAAVAPTSARLKGRTSSRSTAGRGRSPTWRIPTSRATRTRPCSALSGCRCERGRSTATITKRVPTRPSCTGKNHSFAPTIPGTASSPGLPPRRRSTTCSLTAAGSVRVMAGRHG